MPAAGHEPRESPDTNRAALLLFMLQDAIENAVEDLYCCFSYVLLLLVE